MAADLPEAPKFQLMNYKGYYIWDNGEVDDFPGFKCRSDDVWVCSFPRSGTTLTQQIMYLILTLDFETANTVDLDDRFPLFDCYAPEDFQYYRGLKYLDQMPTKEPRMIKSHCHYDILPDEVKAGKGKIIYIVRNPKASVPSLYKVMKYIGNPQAPSLNEYVEKFLTQKDVLCCPWGPHVCQYWEQKDKPNVLFIQFEKLVKDRRNTIKQMADFLGKDLTDEQLDKIVDHTSLESMRNNKTVNFLYFEETYQVDKSEGAFINKGQVSGWRDELSKELIQKMDMLIKKELKDTDIKFD